MEINGLKIDPVIFTFPFGCRCNGECCYYGVLTDKKEADHILENKDKIIPLLDESQPRDTAKWFEPAEVDEDFESGVAVGTEVYNNKCVFLDKDGLCTLQKLAEIENTDKWKYKPLYCILFPLTVYENTLTIDDEHMNRLKSCNKQFKSEQSIFEACKEELKHFLGEEGVIQLTKFRDEYLTGIQSGVI